jgi:hypothetical protein
VILAIAVLTAYIPGYTGATIPTGWAVLWLIMPILLLRCKIEPFPVYGWGAAFLLYAGLSLLWSPHGLLAFMQLCALASVFLWATTLPDLRKVSIGLAIGLGISGDISLFQWSGFQSIFRVTDFPSGLFVNSNVFAEVSAMILVLLLVNRLWWWIPVTAPGLVIGSRASLVALLCVFLAWVWSKSKITAAILIATLGAVTAYSVTTFNNKSINERWGMWADTWNGVTLWGHGIGSFEYLYPYYANHMDTVRVRPVSAHNDLLQLLFEVGIGIVPLLVALWYLARIKDNHRYVLLCFGIIGLFGFPLHIPASAFIAACCAGHLVYRQREFWAASGYRGSAISLGMAIPS